MKYAFLLLITSAGLVFSAPSEDPQEIVRRAGSAWQELKSCEMVARSTSVMIGDEWETTIKSKAHISLAKPGKLRVENRGAGGAQVCSPVCADRNHPE